MVRGAGLAFAAMVFGCSPPPAVPRCPTTVLPACAMGADLYSDEACQRLEDAESRTGVRVDPTQGPIVDAPTEGQTLSSTPPATFRWHGQLMAVAQPRGDSIEPPPSCTIVTFLDHVRRAVDLLPEAHAHCLPFTGIGYALAFRADGAVVARAELSLTEFTPDAATWDVLRRARQPLELTVTASRFRANEVTAGPFSVGASRRFTIGP